MDNLEDSIIALLPLDNKYFLLRNIMSSCE